MAEEEAMELTNKAVLITGGSRGLGQALMKACAEAGARVVGVARDAGAIERDAAALRAEGCVVHGLSGDIGDKQAIYPLAGAAAALIGPIDILIHNASTLGPTPLPWLLDTQCEDLMRVLDVNLLGPFRLTKAIAGGMILRGAGLVVQITSDASIAAYSGWGAYGVSKAALDHLGRIWAAELDGTGVRVLTIDPGEMDTELHAAAMPEADRSRLARPADVARTVLSIIGSSETIGSGSRIEAAHWRKP
jgi:NAD(P)-dependent dehydrogenase (short-subunit alcohol dehydrogenase family)